MHVNLHLVIQSNIVWHFILKLNAKHATIQSLIHQLLEIHNLYLVNIFLIIVSLIIYYNILLNNLSHLNSQ